VAKHTKGGIELTRGNIRVIVSEETYLQAQIKVGEQLAQEEVWRNTSAVDPECHISNPGNHSTHKRVVPTWVPSITEEELTRINRTSEKVYKSYHLEDGEWVEGPKPLKMNGATVDPRVHSILDWMRLNPGGTK
jgi:hypothetical protein